MILVRNPNWKRVERPVPPGATRTSGKSTSASIPRSSTSGSCRASGNDAVRDPVRQVQPENLTTVFKRRRHTANGRSQGRAISGFDPYSRYYWINVNKVKNVKIRQAMAVALDRAAIRPNIGGDFVGDYADGAIKPNIGVDYAPTGFWTARCFGEPVPDNGDPELAKKLIAESGEPAPTLTWNYADSPTGQKTAAIVQSVAREGRLHGHAGADRPGDYYSIVFDPRQLTGDFGTARLGSRTGRTPRRSSRRSSPTIGGWNLSTGRRSLTLTAAIR